MSRRKVKPLTSASNRRVLEAAIRSKVGGIIVIGQQGKRGPWFGSAGPVLPNGDELRVIEGQLIWALAHVRVRLDDLGELYLVDKLRSLRRGQTHDGKAKQNARKPIRRRGAKGK